MPGRVIGDAKQNVGTRIGGTRGKSERTKGKEEQAFHGREVTHGTVGWATLSLPSPLYAVYVFSVGFTYVAAAILVALEASCRPDLRCEMEMPSRTTRRFRRAGCRTLRQAGRPILK